MVIIHPALLQRKLGNLPVSLGTSNALNGVFGTTLPSHEQPLTKDPPYREYSTLAINLRTIVRNIDSSVNSQYVAMLTPSTLTRLVIEEINIITELVDVNTNGAIKVVYYAGMYPNAKQQFPKAAIKTITAPKKLEALQRELAFFEYLREGDGLTYATANLRTSVLDVYDNKPSDELFDKMFGKTLFLTHLPLDLLMSSTRRYALLESHTGRIKNIPQLYTKLQTKEERIPFNIVTIQVFGDTGEMFAPMSKSIRDKVIDLANTHHWHSMTGREKILADIRTNPDAELVRLIQDLFKAG